ARTGGAARYRAAIRIVLHQWRNTLRPLIAVKQPPARRIIRGHLRGERQNALLLFVNTVDELRSREHMHQDRFVLRARLTKVARHERRPPSAKLAQNRLPAPRPLRR